MYSEKVMDHFANPRNVGEIVNASGIGEVGNAKCGDIMKVFLDVDENDIIRDIKFKTFGCGAAIATSSIMTELTPTRPSCARAWLLRVILHESRPLQSPNDSCQK